MRARVLVGDCRVSMASLPDASVDSIVTDPPYELGFMGKSWDASGIAYDLDVWRQALRVLKPGGHLLAFSGSRTYHRMTCAIEDAGFEIRDQIMWLYGSGFPKSLDVSKAIDKAAGAERAVIGSRKLTGTARIKGVAAFGGSSGRTDQAYADASEINDTLQLTAPATDDSRRWSGWGTALKPAHEPICLARKPLSGTVAANVLVHGTGALNVDGCRVRLADGEVVHAPQSDPTQRAGDVGRDLGFTGNDAEAFRQAQRESIERTNTLGRWPANVLHDGSVDVTEGLREAARFFYTAKADRSDRDEVLGDLPARTGAQAVERAEGSAGTQSPRAGAGRTASSVVNHHPTVKPTELMRYLVRMVTPPGGLVLDPFTGSGSTGRAAMLESMRFIGCELSPEYAEIARARIRFTLGPLFAHEVE